MTAKPLLTPTLHHDRIDGTGPRALLAPISADLAEMRAATPGALVGVALGHCTPRPDLPRAISEYMCSVLWTGSGCSPAAVQLQRKATRQISRMIVTRLASDTLATALHDVLACPHPQLETVVFKSFVVSFHFPVFRAPTPEEIKVSIYYAPCSTLALAQRCAVDIREALRVLTEVHDALGAVRIAPPDAEQLLAA